MKNMFIFALERGGLINLAKLNVFKLLKQVKRVCGCSKLED